MSVKLTGVELEAEVPWLEAEPKGVIVGVKLVVGPAAVGETPSVEDDALRIGENDFGVKGGAVALKDEVWARVVAVTNEAVGAVEAGASPGVAEVTSTALGVVEIEASIGVAEVENATLDPNARDDVVVGKESSVGEEKLRAHVVAVDELELGEKMTSADVVVVADEALGGGEELTSADVAGIDAEVGAVAAADVMGAMEKLSTIMWACHALQNTATNEQHIAACSCPFPKP